jgi:hypothetical protein
LLKGDLYINEVYSAALLMVYLLDDSNTFLTGLQDCKKDRTLLFKDVLKDIYESFTKNYHTARDDEELTNFKL